jgi:hypothetical protein
MIRKERLERPMKICADEEHLSTTERLELCTREAKRGSVTRRAKERPGRPTAREPREAQRERLENSESLDNLEIPTEGVLNLTHSSQANRVNKPQRATAHNKRALHQPAYPIISSTLTPISLVP